MTSRAKTKKTASEPFDYVAAKVANFRYLHPRELEQMMTRRYKYPAWLRHVAHVADTPGVVQAQKCLEKTTTHAEQAEAERHYVTAVLAAIAQQMTATPSIDVVR